MGNWTPTEELTSACSLTAACSAEDTHSSHHWKATAVVVVKGKHQWLYRLISEAVEEQRDSADGERDLCRLGTHKALLQAARPVWAVAPFIGSESQLEIDFIQEKEFLLAKVVPSRLISSFGKTGNLWQKKMLARLVCRPSQHEAGPLFFLDKGAQWRESSQVSSTMCDKVMSKP